MKGSLRLQAPPAPLTSQLVAWDFDLTITSQHVYNLIFKKRPDAKALHEKLIAEKATLEVYNQAMQQWSLDNEAALWELIQSICPIGAVGRIKIIFEQLFENQHQLAIVSFNPFQNLIKRYMIDKVMLSPELVEDIIFITEIPLDPEDPNENKNNHLQKAQKIAKNKNQKDYSNNETWLIDDSIKNIQAAIPEEYCTIHASDRRGFFLSAVQHSLIGAPYNKISLRSHSSVFFEEVKQESGESSQSFPLKSSSTNTLGLHKSTNSTGN